MKTLYSHLSINATDGHIAEANGILQKLKTLRD